MFQRRLNTDPHQIQGLTSAILAIHGAVAVVASPFIGHFCDKAPSRKMPLLLSLGACILGTSMVAGSNSVIMLFLGRIIQGIAGTVVWMLGFATVTDTVGQENRGAAIGTMMSCASLGKVSGPAVSGMLIEVAGYWITWSIPCLVLIIDFGMRLMMVESPLGTSEPSNFPEEDCQESLSTTRLWLLMIRDIRVFTALIVSLINTALTSSFQATLPIHVQETFEWGPGPTGLMLSAFAFLGFFLNPLAGFLRDRIGVQIPVTVACFLQAALLGLLGVAGNKQFSWASTHNRGRVFYASCVICIGAVRPFLGGVGPLELIGPLYILSCQYTPTLTILQMLFIRTRATLQAYLDRREACRVCSL